MFIQVLLPITSDECVTIHECNVHKSWDICKDFSNQGLTKIVKCRPFILTCLHQRKGNRHGWCCDDWELLEAWVFYTVPIARKEPPGRGSECGSGGPSTERAPCSEQNHRTPPVIQPF